MCVFHIFLQSVSDCFDSVNGSLIVANHTTHFFDLLNSTQVCFLNHSTGDDTYNKSACVDCEKMYCDMNTFYDDLKNSKLNECMDIKDAVSYFQDFAVQQ